MKFFFLPHIYTYGHHDLASHGALSESLVSALTQVHLNLVSYVLFNVITKVSLLLFEHPILIPLDSLFVIGESSVVAGWVERSVCILLIVLLGSWS